MIDFRRAAIALCPVVWLSAVVPAHGDDGPVLPAAFLPAGILGVQLGTSWAQTLQNPSIRERTCQPAGKNAAAFDEVCFFKTSSRMAGAEIHDGFIVRKDDRVVLIGTGIAIKNVDDPVAEAVMRQLQTQVHAKFQQTGDNVLFADLPERRLTAGEMAGISGSFPVLLVELEPDETEIAVFYGYLAPVNAMSALAVD